MISFLLFLKIFYNNINLNIKFKKLANTANFNDWITYFYLNDQLYHKELDRKKFKDNINELKKNTSNKNLIFLINKK